MSSLDNNPFHCPKHGFIEVITAEGVGSVPKDRCPFCRAEAAEAKLEAVRPLVDQIVTAPKGSIGGLFTHYLPQLRVDDVDKLRALLDTPAKEKSDG